MSPLLGRFCLCCLFLEYFDRPGLAGTILCAVYEYYERSTRIKGETVKEKGRKIKIMESKTIDEQVRLVRLQTDNFHLFLCQQMTRQTSVCMMSKR
jgi:hypothetical protein